MGHVITVVGAGGKSTWIRTHAEAEAGCGKRVAVTTTTHIWNPAVTYGSLCSGACGARDSRNADNNAGGRFCEDVRGDSGGSVSTSGEAGAPAGGDCGRTDLIEQAPGPAPVLPVCRLNGVDYFGAPLPDGKLGPLAESEFRDICGRYDAVYVEGDGSRFMPVKIPAEHEPAVPDGTDEIVVIMGRQAVGRRLDAVCQRFPDYLRRMEFSGGEEARIEGSGMKEACHASEAGGSCQKEAEGTKRVGRFCGSEIVTQKLLFQIADTFYIRPLKEKFPCLPIRFELGGPDVREGAGLLRGQMPEAGRPAEKAVSDAEADGSGGGRQMSVTLVLMASGFGRRYGGNKLLDAAPGQNLPMAEMVLRNLKVAAAQLGRYGIGAGIVIVTQYREIAKLAERMAEEESHEGPGSAVLWNDEAEEGISASIRIGTQEAVRRGTGAVAFFTADMPYLPSVEITRFLSQFLCSGKTFGCMEYRRVEDGKMQPTVPGAMRLDRRLGPPLAENPARRIGKGREERVSDALLALHGDRGAMRIIRQYPWDTYLYPVSSDDAADIDSPIHAGSTM